jgi:hypothetical protein
MERKTVFVEMITLFALVILAFVLLYKDEEHA